jgi:hypothetical protein
MAETNVNALIVRHLGDIDAAARQVEYDLQPNVAKSLNEIVKAWAESRKWEHEAKWFHDGETYVAPACWKNTDEDKKNNPLYCWFELNTSAGDDYRDVQELDYFWLTRLCKSGRGMLGFRWTYNGSLIPARGRRWRQFSSDHVEGPRKAGFVYEESKGLFFRQVHIDAGKLAQAIENDAIKDALGPIEEALDTCFAAKGVFGEILNRARSEFPLSA